MIILTADPGKMTGWAAFDTERHELLGAKQAPGYEFLDQVVPWVDGCAGRTDVMVILERFVISGGTVEKGRTDENWSIEQIGVLRHHARWAGIPFELQSAGDAKSIAPNPRLREIGWYVPGRDHANDALRHVILALGRHHVDALNRLLTML
jgi:hypothetical protein